MSKSKCPMCGKVLKGGEWRFLKTSQGQVIKVCNDARQCDLRKAMKGDK